MLTIRQLSNTNICLTSNWTTNALIKQNIFCQELHITRMNVLCSFNLILLLKPILVINFSSNSNLILTYYVIAKSTAVGFVRLGFARLYVFIKLFQNRYNNVVFNADLHVLYNIDIEIFTICLQKIV